MQVEMNCQPESTNERVVGNLQWDGMQRPQIYYAVAAIFSGIFLAIMDSSICNVALPSIARDLHVPSSDAIWVVNAFQLIIMMTLLPFASLGELYGYKRVYVCGVAIFTVGSLCSSLSRDLTMLISSRVFQGVGASLIMSVNTSLIKLIYPKKFLGRGIGLNATVVALAAVTGPTLAAAILSVAPWPWLFAVNIPVGTLTFFLAWKFLPKNPVKVLGRKFDTRSALLNMATFGLLIGCIAAFSHGLPVYLIVLGFVLLMGISTVYVRTQLKQPYPMLPFDLLRIPIFSLSLLTSIVSFTAQMLCMVALPFLFESTFRYTAVETGLLMTAWPFVIIFVAPLAGYLVAKIRPGLLGGVGLSVMSVGCFLLAYAPADTSHAGLVWRLMLCGMGFGFFQSPNNDLLLSTPPPERAGSASGMLASARLLGQTIGAALVALFFHLSGNGTGTHRALLLAGILTLVGAVCSCSRLKERMPGKK